tara:strand:- start:1717 stop:2001 length:285 start_codon:yes stop_codon:yes gene_type:complete
MINKLLGLIVCIFISSHAFSVSYKKKMNSHDKSLKEINIKEVNLMDPPEMSEGVEALENYLSKLVDDQIRKHKYLADEKKKKIMDKDNNVSLKK